MAAVILGMAARPLIEKPTSGLVISYFNLVNHAWRGAAAARGPRASTKPRDPGQAQRPPPRRHCAGASRGTGNLSQSLQRTDVCSQAARGAAVRYFVSEEDARPDTEGVLGLDDDIEVFTSVAEQIGQVDRKVDI